MVNFSCCLITWDWLFNEGEDMMSEEDIITQNMIQEVGNPGSQLEQPFECKLLSEEDVTRLSYSKNIKIKLFGFR